MKLHKTTVANHTTGIDYKLVRTFTFKNKDARNTQNMSNQDYMHTHTVLSMTCFLLLNHYFSSVTHSSSHLAAVMTQLPPEINESHSSTTHFIRQSNTLPPNADGQPAVCVNKII